MAASQSRLPKAQRVARVLDQEPMPDPEDYFLSAKYIDRRAEVGDFNGSPAGTVGVLQYLWRHTVLTDELPGECQGWLLTGKSKLGKIATECSISYNGLRNVLDWLEANGWIWRLLDKKAGNKLSIKVLMDQEAHNARTLRLGIADPMPCGGIGYDTTEQTLCHVVADNTSTSTSILTTTSTSEGKSAAAEGKKKPRANMPQFDEVRRATSPRASKGSSAPLDAPAPGPQVPGHSYTYWEKDGSWLVFPSAQVKYKAKGAVTVTLRDEENEFYRTFFRGGKDKNESRAIFLEMDQEERATSIEWCKEHPEARAA